MGDMSYEDDVTRLSRLETVVLPELEDLLLDTRPSEAWDAVCRALKIVQRELERVSA